MKHTYATETEYITDVQYRDTYIHRELMRQMTEARRAGLIDPLFDDFKPNCTDAWHSTR